ncbi:MAG: TIGR03936 family radical SAM-associated protein [Lachnospiraceae bacterium]|nr:TIGR03936 family radical SAM-associated protein [Ruminococcus sp.]MCM1274536.1 TIGR03936 family radical SAM-associated protein [Lachnospiraceae bacterium]
MPSVNTRVFFGKTNRAKYISHLDLNSVMQRAIRRARLPIWYTEGYSPHMYVQFMLPLPLGQEGLREAMDFRLLEDVPYLEVTERLNSALPLDIRAVEAAAPVLKNTDITTAEYEITADIDNEKFLKFAQSEKIIVEKKTKKGTSEIDLKPLISGLTAGERITLRLPAGNDFNINPALLLDAYRAASGEEVRRLRIVRTRILCAEGSEFR